MAQVHTKVLVDSRMRDVKRRVEVIQKKVADLQEMGVPCAFCYSSVRNPGSIFTIGDKRITQVMEKYRNKILCNLMDESHIPDPGDGESSSQEIHLILPVLPAPLEELNRTTLQSIVIGILKDLDIRWSDPKPVWWPAEIPFIPPHSIPENYSGNWISALKKILKSVYDYFSYDIDSYVTGKLETTVMRSREASSNAEEGIGSDQHGDSYEDSYEEDSVQGVSEQTTRSSIIRNVAPMMQSNKSISSFTVENILMGKQSPNYASSSSTSVSNSQSPTSSVAASLPSPTPLGPMSSSVVGVNWVSHPPVKYTKFTILSPTAMSDEAKRKKSSNSSLQSASTRSEQERVHTAATASGFRNINSRQPSQVVYARQTSSEAAMISTPVYSLSPLSASSNVKELPASSAPLASSAKICTLPLVTALQPSSSSSDGKMMLSKSFPPSQQYVLLVPSSSVASAVQSTPHVSSSMTQKGLYSPSVGNSMKNSIIKTASFQSPPAATSTAYGSSNRDISSSSNGGSERLERDNRHANEYNFRLIAPKQKHRVSGSSANARGRSKLRGRMPQKLRFHMTTVVTKQKRVPVKSSMTVESPSVVAIGNPQNVVHPTNRNRSSENTLPVESMITQSPNIYSNVPSKAVKAEAPDAESYSTQLEHGLASSPYNGVHNRSSPSRNYRTGSAEDLHAASAKHKDDSSQQSREPIGTTRHRSRATRSYTRRKRELTFHLYEEPGTAFKAKRACKE